jgi:hypothetical protein
MKNKRKKDMFLCKICILGHPHKDGREHVARHETKSLISYPRSSDKMIGKGFTLIFPLVWHFLVDVCFL